MGKYPASQFPLHFKTTSLTSPVLSTNLQCLCTLRATPYSVEVSHCARPERCQRLSNTRILPVVVVSTACALLNGSLPGAGTFGAAGFTKTFASSDCPVFHFCRIKCKKVRMEVLSAIRRNVRSFVSHRRMMMLRPYCK